MEKIAREQALKFRLERHHLDQRLPSGALVVAAGACGLQNTPPGAAALSLHARVEQVNPHEVDAALYEGKILLQAWSLRAAPHVFPTRSAADFTLGLLPPDEESLQAFLLGAVPFLEKIGLRATDLVALCAAGLEEVLEGPDRTKDELGVGIARWIAPRLSADQQADWESPSWIVPSQTAGESAVRFALPVLSLQGRCCHTRRVGNQALIGPVARWLGISLPEEDQAAAQAGLARRYLRCYEPSTPADFAAWAGIGLAQARQAWRRIEAELDRVGLEGRACSVLQEDLPRLRSPAEPEGVRLLPAHDPFLQQRDRDVLVEDPGLRRRLWRTAGSPGVLLANGRVAGAWTAQKHGARLAVSLAWFRPVSGAIQEQAETEAAGMARFRGCASVVVTHQIFP